MPRFNHAFDIAFEVITDDPEGENVTPAILKAALLKRIENLDEDDSWLEAAGAPFDTYEVDEPHG